MGLGGLHVTQHFHLSSSPHPTTILSRYCLHTIIFKPLEVWVNVQSYVLTTTIESKYNLTAPESSLLL